MPVPISIASLTKTFGSGAAAVTAVDDIDLAIEPGELFFLLGPSGCGKTTLLRMIAGFEEPTHGRIRFGERDVTHVPANKRNTGMVFQSYALWPHMTVEANVAFGLGVRHVRGDDRRRRIDDALRSVRMEAYAKRKPNQLSGGQQQRVALARAIVIRPDVLLLDEPLSNLDAKLRNELRVEIRRVCKQAGITTVYVTHDQKEALSMADRVAVLDQGKVVQVGTPSELYRRPASRFVAGFLGEANFLDGRIAAVDNGHVRVDTKVGTLLASPTAPVEVGDTVTLSIRPEAWCVHDRGEPGAPNHMAAKVLSTTYLGETAHHDAEHDSGWQLRISELNPRIEGSDGRRQVFLSVEPDQVTALAR